jgi:beta-mannosidase
LDWDFQTEILDIDRLKVRVSLSRNNRVVFEKVYPVILTHDMKVIELESVDFWWPMGYGEAALYDAVVELLDEDGTILDGNRSRIGIRTAKLQRTEITSERAEGEFVFIINGERVFARGTNWVPLDALHSRDSGHLRKTFDMMIDLHCNMVRCWGGNVYEDREFFDLCDENGIMVWQDFALACIIYPQNSEFLEKISKEATSVVRKFRNHPSLLLWAGNNEIDETYKWAGFGIDPNTDIISREVLPSVIRREDPGRDYLPSSPYHSPEMIRRGNSDRLKPEDHLWGPRDDAKSSFYTHSPAHFVSEIGFHGCPCRETLEEMLDEEQQNLDIY